MGSTVAITGLAAARLSSGGDGTAGGTSLWYVLSGGGGTVRCWPAAAAREEADLMPCDGSEPSAMTAARLPGGGDVVVARFRRRLRHEDRNFLLRWDRVTGRRLGDPVRFRAPPLLPGLKDPLVLVDGPRGPAAVTAVAGGLRCWDLATGEPAGAVFGRRHRLAGELAAGTLPGGDPVLVSSGADGLIRRHDPVSGAEVGMPIRGCGRAVALAVTRLDGRAVVCVLSSRGYVHRRDLMTGKPAGPRISTGWQPGAGAAWCSSGRMAVAPAGPGGTIATCTDTRTVRLWDLASGEPRGFLGPPRPLTGLVAAEAPDGAPLLVTAARDGSVRRYDARTGCPYGDPLRPHGP